MKRNMNNVPTKCAGKYSVDEQTDAIKEHDGASAATAVSGASSEL